MGTTIRGCDVEASELQTILQEHAEWLRNKGGKRANLSGAYLSGAYLTRANLSRANLTGADLTGADLTWANLTWAYLTRANLSRANLTGADLTGADLTWANLTWANLTGADLSGAYLTRANLTGADLTRANLSGAYLTRADLTWADLTRANLTRANLTRANLTGADLTGADLTWANLTWANLTNTCLSPELGKLQRAFALACPPVGRHGGRIVYRTYKSQHVCTTTYEPGHTYVAPILSFSVETACHPGIYAGSMKWIDEEYPNMPLVRCYVRDGDWIITAKGAIRCKRLRVLGMVDDGGRR
jgi:uncharacterized protein YjbI with pentapeptide repeats